MAYERKQHSGSAPDTTLTADIGNSATSFTVGSGTGYPDGSIGNFIVILDPDTSKEEHVLCSSTIGNTINVVTRGYDGTTAQSHSATATVRHGFSAVEADEANQAVVNTLGKVTSVGDLLVGSGTATLKRLGKGTAYQMLRVKSDGSDLEYGPPVETVTSITVTGSTTLNADSGNSTYFKLSMQQPATLAFSNVPSGVVYSCTVKIIQDAIGGRTVTWPTGTKWDEASQPPQNTSANTYAIYTLTTDDGGTTWSAFCAGKGMG